HSAHLIPEQSLMPERDPFDPLAALRTMPDVQRAGLEAAASVVARILDRGRTRRLTGRVRFAACGRMANDCSSCGVNGCEFSSTRLWTAPRRASPSKT